MKIRQYIVAASYTGADGGAPSVDLRLVQRPNESDAADYVTRYLNRRGNTVHSVLVTTIETMRMELWNQPVMELG